MSIVPAAELGIKRQCPSCAVRFYDLHKPAPLTCIKCGHRFDPDLVTKTRKVARLVIESSDDEAAPSIDPFEDAFVAAGAGDSFDDAEPEVRRAVRDDALAEDDLELVADDELPDELPDEHGESEPAVVKKPRR